MNYKQLNPFFQKIGTDHLYHLGFDSSMDLAGLFGNIKYIILTSSSDNTNIIANLFATTFYNIKDTTVRCEPIGKNERYLIHRVHNSLIISHGVGAPSLLICLNELSKLMWHSRIATPKIFRLNLTQGLGVSCGTMVIGKEAVDNTLNPQFKSIEFGQEHVYPTSFNQQLADEFIRFHQDQEFVKGKIISGIGGYENLVHFDNSMTLNQLHEEQHAYLQQAYACEVRSFNMEATGFASFCNQLDIPACEINVAGVDILNASNTTTTRQKEQQYLTNAAKLVIDYAINHHPAQE